MECNQLMIEIDKFIFTKSTDPATNLAALAGVQAAYAIYLQLDKDQYMATIEKSYDNLIKSIKFSEKLYERK